MFDSKNSWNPITQRSGRLLWFGKLMYQLSIFQAFEYRKTRYYLIICTVHWIYSDSTLSFSELHYKHHLQSQSPTGTERAFCCFRGLSSEQLNVVGKLGWVLARVLLMQTFDVIVDQVSNDECCLRVRKKYVN